MPFKYKQVIVLRKDIGMGAGKAIAQGAHVAVKSAMAAKDKDPVAYKAWLDEGHAKIALRVNSLEELMACFHAAVERRMVVQAVVDQGLTQLSPGTITAIAIGPDEVDKVDAITKDLKLW